MIQSQRLAHDLIVDFLATLGAQVQTHFIDHLDTEVAQPVFPAVGAHRFEDALAQLVAHGRLGQLVGVRAGSAARPLALKATVSVKPPLGVMVAVYEVLLPAATVCEEGAAVMVKSPVTGAFTTRLIDAVCVSVPSVPLIVNG